MWRVFSLVHSWNKTPKIYFDINYINGLPSGSSGQNIFAKDTKHLSTLFMKRKHERNKHFQFMYSLVYYLPQFLQYFLTWYLKILKDSNSFFLEILIPLHQRKKRENIIIVVWQNWQNGFEITQPNKVKWWICNSNVI